MHLDRAKQIPESSHDVRADRLDLVGPNKELYSTLLRAYGEMVRPEGHQALK